LPNHIGRWRRSFRTLYIGLATLATGVLPNHLSCTRIVQDSLSAGAGDFLTNTTTEILNAVFLPGGLGGGGPDAGGGVNGDPFEPPVQT